MAPEEQTLALANAVADSLAKRGAKSAVIGAIAVAVHGYPRSTQDLDLATATDLAVLREVASDLQTRGCIVKLGEPDHDDPLGELKACECIAPIHVAQTLSYLKSTRLRLALLINFDVAVLQRGIKRIIHTP